MSRLLEYIAIDIEIYLASRFVLELAWKLNLLKCGLLRNRNF